MTTTNWLAANAVSRRRMHSGVSHGTLGELFQGPYSQNGNLEIAIVSLPVEKFSWVYFIHDPKAASCDASALSGRTKCQQAIALFLERYGKDLPGGRWDFSTELDVGIGMGSSTADIVATLRCLFGIFRIEYSQGTVQEILSLIERADSVFLDEFALYLSGRHEIVHRFDARMTFYTCYVVEEGCVETEEMEGTLLSHYRAHRESYEGCLTDLVSAFRASDVRGVCRAATRSSMLSQRVLPKESFAEVMKHRQTFEAAGIFVAHTGCIIGYLFEKKPDRIAMGELSAFFRGMGRQCYFARGGL